MVVPARAGCRNSARAGLNRGTFKAFFCYEPQKYKNAHCPISIVRYQGPERNPTS
jgi:hypothetical protein